MILYKYVDFDTAFDHILKNKTVKFTRPGEFNDPFETTARQARESIAEDDINFAFDDFCQHIGLNQSYGILCLTRNPGNLLMWAHYATGKRPPSTGISFRGDAHCGIVIGIDTAEAGFDDEEKNVVPAKFGSVIYSTTKPSHAYGKFSDLLFRGRIKEFRSGLLEEMQRIFLYKSHDWSYEEEVRIIKNISTSQTCIQPIPVAAIKEVYIGYGQTVAVTEIRKRIVELVPEAKIFLMERNNLDWRLKARAITSMVGLVE